MEVPSSSQFEEDEPRDSAPVLKVSNLTKHYQAIVAVDNLSFQINNGEIYGLLGPNGAGKTTTIKAIMGMLEIDNGDISLLGKDPIKEPKEVKKRIGYVAEEPLLYDSLTPNELFNFIASIRELDEKTAVQRTRNLLDSFDANQYYHDLIATLSKGNKQKMQIISSLIHDPPLLILDEPLSGLDAKSRKLVRNILDLHTKSGKAVLLSTHAMEDVQGLCDRVGIINKGKLVAEGTLEELSELSNTANGSFEDVFLKLTDQDQHVASATAKLEDNYAQQDKGEAGNNGSD